MRTRTVSSIQTLSSEHKLYSWTHLMSDYTAQKKLIFLLIALECITDDTAFEFMKHRVPDLDKEEILEFFNKVLKVPENVV